MSHEIQKELITKCIEHLQIAYYYSHEAFKYTTESKFALSAELEPEHIHELIERGETQLSEIGLEWDIHHSVVDLGGS